MASFKRSSNFFEITSIAADVDSKEIFQDSDLNVKKVKRIEFIVGNANDILVVKEANDAGPEITRLGSTSTIESDRCYFEGGQYMKPFIDFGDCTLNAGHKVIIELE